jgi:hypothetical protein
MQKSRKKADIRSRMAAEREELVRRADEARAFRTPRAQSWHDLVLRALLSGATLEAAAHAAGVTRAGIRYARQHNRRFAEAYARAYATSMRVRTDAAAAKFAFNRSATNQNSLTHWMTQWRT